MRCSNCQADVPEGAAFCGQCGSAIPAQPVETAAQPTEPMPEAAQQMPQQTAQPPAYDATAYAQQYAQPAAPPQYGQQPPVAPKKRTGLIIAIVVIAVLLLVGCSVGGYVVYRALTDNGDEPPATIETPVPADQPLPATGGYATADEAVFAELDAAGYGDWVYQLYDETEGQATYWAGPPASEFVEEIVVARGADGTWSVTSVNALDFGGDVPQEFLTPTDQAMAVVDGHLLAIYEDRADDAHAFTVDPFASDPASAMYSNGDFFGWEITGATEQSDGTFWVRTTQEWTWGSEAWEYWVVPTELGYYIADVRAP